MGLVSLIKTAQKFITDDLWQVDMSRYPYMLQWLMKQLKVIIFTLKNYFRHRIQIRSASLVFFTLMSIVPIMAMVLGIAKGFGLEHQLVQYIGGIFGNYKEVYDQINIFANSFLENQKVGVFAGVSIFVFVWAVIMVFGNTEAAFNDIWEIKKTRTISRKVSDYLSIMFLLPILFVLYSSVSSHIEGQLFSWTAGMTILSNILNILLSLAHLMLIWLIFTSVYYILPNTRVKVLAAFSAGMVSGTAYLLFEWGYIVFQQTVSSYSIIYGSFAALPLFLIWLNVSWQILLFGAELSFAYQHIKQYEYERKASLISNNLRRSLIVMVMHSIIRNFTDKNPPLSAEELSDRLNVPMGAVSDVIFTLEKSGVLTASPMEDQKGYIYTPAYDISNLTIWDLLSIVDNMGENNFGQENPMCDKVVESIRMLGVILKDSPYNNKIKDLEL